MPRRAFKVASCFGSAGEAGHHQDPGPGPAIANCHLTSPITNPTLNLPQYFPERAGAPIRGVADQVNRKGRAKIKNSIKLPIIT